MTPSAKFVERSEHAGIPYVKETVASLRDGTAKITSEPDNIVPVSTDELLRTYKRRVAHLAKITTDHAKILGVDAKMLCDSLCELPGRLCGIWIVEREPYYIYSFFETVDDHRIFGVIKSVDDRKISDADRVHFWGAKR